MSASRFYLVITVLFVFGLFVSWFVLPVGYSYSQPCSTCQSKGTVGCAECNGSGKCWFCGGTGNFSNIPGSWCAPCRGSGACHECDGVGTVVCGMCGGSGIWTRWFYTVAGSAVVLSVVNVLLFLGFFSLNYLASAFYLDFNEWVYHVEDMDFWFNPSFMTWLFAKHRDRWATWQTGLNLLFAVYFGALLFWAISIGKVAAESLHIGILLGFTVVSVFSLLFYESYTSRLSERPD